MSQLDLNDLITHRAAWRKAISIARDLSSTDSETDDAGYWRHELEVFDRTFAIFAPTTHAPAPLPDGITLPPEAEAHYRLLLAEGFISVDRSSSPGLDTTCRVWIAPDGDRLTREQMVALATLQEHGFGPVVNP